MAIVLQGNSFISAAGGGGGGGGGGGVVLENCKGFIHVFSDNGGEGQSSGFYEISPAIPETDGSRALILGIPLTFREIVQPTTTLDDKRVMYLFGTAWNEVNIGGILLLGTSETRGAQLAELISWYNSNRVSELRGPISCSLGTVGIDAFVVGLSLSEANPRVNTQSFNISLLTADVLP